MFTFIAKITTAVALAAATLTTGCTATTPNVVWYEAWGDSHLDSWLTVGCRDDLAAMNGNQGVWQWRNLATAGKTAAEQLPAYQGAEHRLHFANGDVTPVLVVSYGTNEALKVRQNIMTMQAAKDGVTALIAAAQANGQKILWVLPQDWAGMLATLPEAAEIRAFIWGSVWAVGGQLVEPISTTDGAADMASDGIHYTRAAYTSLAARIVDRVNMMR